jgi:hypothetical protein
MSYTATQGDEVEDLLQLLAWARQRHPQLQAVSSGAIASDYQRLRVEHVRVPCPHCPFASSCSATNDQPTNPFSPTCSATV